jgi:uncharacterized spore protein YtfJ
VLSELLSVVEQEVKTTVDELLKVISTKNVISEPIEVGDNVVITITKIGLGFGTATGEGKSDTSHTTGSGQGVGGAAGISPLAVVIIHKNAPGPNGVEVKSLTPPSQIGKAIGEIASAVVDRVGARRAAVNKEAEEKAKQ